jgi:hypothetical protein
VEESGAPFISHEGQHWNTAAETAIYEYRENEGWIENLENIAGC